MDDDSPRIACAVDRPAAAATFVIVSAHEEGARIGATLRGLGQAFPGAAVLVADDGSRDDTAAIARSAGAQVLSSGRVLGKGASATRAAREALRQVSAVHPNGADEAIIVLCDGDLGESAGELGALAEPILRGEADVVVAAFRRRVGGGVGLARGFARWAIARRCGFSASAPISGQRALRAAALSDVLPFAHGFGMEVGMTIDAVRAGHRVVEIELELCHRASGRTPAGFAHRARQLADFVRAYLARR